MLNTSPGSPINRRSTISAQKRNLLTPVKPKRPREDNNNTVLKSPTTNARKFALWYQQMIDNDRHNFILYLAESATLEWFGRTIRTRKKISGFLKFDMQCTSHDFTSIVNCEKFTTRGEKNPRESLKLSEDSILATPIKSPRSNASNLLTRLSMRGSSCKKRPGLRSNSTSPENHPIARSENSGSKRKRFKKTHTDSINVDNSESDSGNGKSETKFLRKLKSRRHFFEDKPIQNSIESVGNKGDNIIEKNVFKNKAITSTNPKLEQGQGDCNPSTSGTGSSVEIPHINLYNELPRKYVECNGLIEFTRTRSNRLADAMKWERKCKVQICYTEDPLNVDEYIIWALCYSDESKCRRNLLAAFEEAAKHKEKDNIN